MRCTFYTKIYLTKVVIKFFSVLCPKHVLKSVLKKWFKMDEESVTKKHKMFVQTKLNFPVSLYSPTEKKNTKK